MKIDINININLDEIKELLSNCDEMRQFLTSNIKEMPSKVADIGENSEDEKPANKGLEHQVEVTMETVRKMSPWLRLPNRPARWLISGRGYSNVQYVRGQSPDISRAYCGTTPDVKLQRYQQPI